MTRKPMPLQPVATIPEEPEIPKRYSGFEKDAYRDGWKVAHNKLPRHARISYSTHEEREAFNRGWDDRSSLILIEDILR
jgi:hypothetical protein